MRSFLVAVFALSTTAASTVAQAPSADVRALLALDSLWARNYATHDTVNALKLMADDFFMVSTNGTATKDRAAEMADVRPTAGMKVHYFRTVQPRAHVYGATGVVSGVAEWSTDLNGRTGTARRRYIAVYARGGPLGWRLVELHMAPPPP